MICYWRAGNLSPGRAGLLGERAGPRALRAGPSPRPVLVERGRAFGSNYYFKIRVASSRNFASRVESEFTKCEFELSRVGYCELRVKSS